MTEKNIMDAPELVEVTQDLVREIAKNLGASVKLTEALIEKMWRQYPGCGIRGWHPVANRDQAVVLVDQALSGIWRD